MLHRCPSRGLTRQRNSLQAGDRLKIGEVRQSSYRRTTHRLSGLLTVFCGTNISREEDPRIRHVCSSSETVSGTILFSKRPSSSLLPSVIFTVITDNFFRTICPRRIFVRRKYSLRLPSSASNFHSIRITSCFDVSLEPPKN